MLVALALFAAFCILDESILANLSQTLNRARDTDCSGTRSLAAQAALPSWLAAQARTEAWRAHYTSLAAVSVGPSSVLETLGDQLRWEFSLQPDQLRRGVAYTGAASRLRALMHGLASGRTQSLRVAVIGGSISWGSAVKRGQEDWFRCGPGLAGGARGGGGAALLHGLHLRLGRHPQNAARCSQARRRRHHPGMAYAPRGGSLTGCPRVPLQSVHGMAGEGVPKRADDCQEWLRARHPLRFHGAVPGACVPAAKMGGGGEAGCCALSPGSAEGRVGGCCTSTSSCRFVGCWMARRREHTLSLRCPPRPPSSAGEAHGC